MNAIMNTIANTIANLFNPRYAMFRAFAAGYSVFAMRTFCRDDPMTDASLTITYNAICGLMSAAVVMPSRPLLCVSGTLFILYHTYIYCVLVSHYKWHMIISQLRDD
jgi:hypothetical protein